MSIIDERDTQDSINTNCPGHTLTWISGCSGCNRVLMPVFVSLLIHIMDEDLNTIHGKLVPGRLGLFIYLFNVFIFVTCGPFHDTKVGDFLY